MKVRLWLDDVRPPPEGWRWARTVDEAKKILSENEVVECSLDHDLGLHEVEDPDDLDEFFEVAREANKSATETGLDLVNWMLETHNVPRRITIHSWNPAGAHNMAARLNHYGYDCAVVPFVVSK